MKGEKKRSDSLEAELATCVCTGLRMSARVMTRLYDEALAPSGVRITQLATLATVAFRGPITVKALAKVLLMDRTTLTADLKPLESKGFLEITPGQDRRTRIITLTRSGRAALEKAIPLWREAQSRVKRHLGEGQLHNLLGGLSEVMALPKEE
jgi:DNA-binding MarR family transcriptional regulator